MDQPLDVPAADPVLVSEADVRQALRALRGCEQQCFNSVGCACLEAADRLEAALPATSQQG